jgi:galactosamine-6-phosphate isomerase
VLEKLKKESLLGFGGLRIEVADTYESMSRSATEVILTELKQNPGLLLCVSAGGTPSGTYQGLVDRAARQPELFCRLRILQIDEWAGLAPANPATCESDLRAKLISPLRIRPDRFIGFHSNAPDRTAECARISKWLVANGPIDICLLGLGTNGHVAMNEPASSFIPHAHVARLAETSRHHVLLKDLARKPRYGLTLGMGEILGSKKILVLVSGPKKRAPVKRLMKPEVTTRSPASLLWLHHDALILCDKAAAPKI